jgi:hypothetical protein
MKGAILNKAVFLLTASLLSVLAGVSPLSAQDHQCSVSGIVRDVDGAPLPDAVALLHSSDREKQQFRAETDGSGRFLFAGIAPGKYILRVERGSERLALSLNVAPDQDVALDLRLSKEAEPPSPPLLAAGQTGLMHIFTAEFFRSLPLQRNAVDSLRLSPGVFGDDLFNIHGATVRGIRTNVDGIDITDPLDGIVLIDLPYEAIEITSVAAGNISSASDAGEGARLSIALGRGGDGYHGEVNLFYSQRLFAAEEQVPRAQEERRDYSPVFTLGGPFAGSDSWFYAAAAYEYSDSKDSPGRFKPLEIRGPMLSGKIDWTPGDSLDLHFDYLAYLIARNRQYAPDTTQYEILESDANLVTADSNRSAHALQFAASKHFASDSMAYAKFNYFRNNLKVQPTSGDTATPTIVDPYPQGGYRLYQGSIQPTWRDESSVRNTLDLGYSFSLDEAGKHDLLLGAEAVWTDIDITSDYNGGYLEEFYSPAQLPYRRFSFSQNGKIGFSDERSIRRYSAFIRDRWSPTPLVGIDLGARIERSTGANTSASIFSWNSLSPRLGIIVDPFGDGMTLIRAGYSRFTDPLLGIYIPSTPYELVTEYYDAATGSWSASPLNKTETLGYSPGYVDPDAHPPHWDEWTLGIERELPGAIAMSLTYIHRTQKGIIEDIERNLWPNYTTATASDLYGNQYSYYVQQPGLDGTRNPVYYLTNIDGLYRRYRGMELVLRSSPSPAFMFCESFTWSKTEGNIDNTLEESTGLSPSYNNPNERINADGYLSSDHRYSLRSAVVYAAPKGFYISAVVRMDTGAPLERLLLNPDTGLYEIRSSPRGGTYRKDAGVTVDLRIEKIQTLWRGQIALAMDIFNLLDDDSTIEYIAEDDGFGLPLLRREPRSIRWGIKYSF